MVKRLVGKGRPRSTRYYRWWWWYLQKKRKGRGGPSDIPIWDELPNLDELIFASSGDVSEDGTWLYGGPGNHCPNGQMKGSAAAGNGTMYGQIDGLLTSHTFTVGDGSGTPTCTTNGRLDIANGAYVWDLKVWDGETLIADLAMICLGSGTEFSSTAGLPDCVWNPPVAVQLPSHPGVPTQHEVDPGEFYEVFTDGTGSNRANEDGYSVLDIGPETATTTAIERTGFEYTDFVGGIGSMSGSSDGNGNRIAGFNLVGVSAGDEVLIEYNADVTTLTYIQERDIIGGAPTTLEAVVNGPSSILHTTSYDNPCITFSVVDGNAGEVSISGFSVKRQDVPDYIVPAAYPDVETQCLGPIAADMLLGGIGIQGDGVRYVDIPGLLTTDTIIGDATCTTNGRLDIADGTVCHSVTVERSGEEWAFYHMEDGQPGQAVAKVEDVKGGNHGTIIDPVAAQLPSTPEDPYPIQRALETAWVQTEVGPCYRMVGGFNLDKEGPDVVESYQTGQDLTEDPAGTFTCDVVSGVPNDNRIIIGTTLGDVPATLSFTVLVAGVFEYYTGVGYDSLGTLDPGDYSYTTTTLSGNAYLRIRTAGSQANNIMVKQLILGYSCEDMNNPGYDVDGDPIQWKAGQYETFLNAGILVQGSLGPETQALTTWKDGAWVDISTLPFNIDDKEFYCDKGLALYNTPQDLESINDIGSVICSSYVPDYNLVKNGEFYNDLSRWTPTQWEWQEPGRAAPVHTTSNTLKQTIDMEAGDNITVSFQYHLEAGATLYVKLGNPSGINDIVIAGPADGTHTSIETATGDTIQFAITGAATLDDWIDNVRIEKSDGNIMTDQ